MGGGGGGVSIRGLTRTRVSGGVGGGVGARPACVGRGVLATTSCTWGHADRVAVVAGPCIHVRTRIVIDAAALVGVHTVVACLRIPEPSCTQL